MKLDERTRTAHHEAAHAIVALSCGCRVTSVDIVRTAGRLGVCTYGPPKALLHQLAILLAGAEAAHQLAWCRGTKHLQSASSDIRGIAEVLHENNLTTDDPLLSEARRLTRRLVAEYWSAIAKLATWLLRNQVASGALATAIYLSHELSRKEQEQ